MIICNCNFGGNIGDLMATPRRYFPELRDALEFYPTTSISLSQVPDQPVIIGGGGMFCSGSDILMARFVGHRAPVIVWSAGTNHSTREHPWEVPPQLDQFQLVGVRDYGQKYEYVPCVSCLHEELDRQRRPVASHVVVSHHQWPIVVNTGRFYTNDLGEKMHVMVDIILSARTVITNSYHVAYWAMLLNRRVLGYEIRHNKFRFLKYQPVYVDAKTWRSQVEGLPNAPEGYLHECRRLNREFFERVRALAL